jgi:hypothetical protein
VKASQGWRSDPEVWRSVPAGWKRVHKDSHITKLEINKIRTRTKHEE